MIQAVVESNAPEARVAALKNLATLAPSPLLLDREAVQQALKAVKEQGGEELALEAIRTAAAFVAQSKITDTMGVQSIPGVVQLIWKAIMKIFSFFA